MSKLLKQSFYYALGEIVPKIVSFLLLPIYTRFLSTTDYGILNYTNSFVMFLFVLCTLSLNTYLLRYYFDKDDEIYRKKIVGNIFLTIAGVNIFFSALSYLLLPLFIQKYNIQVPWKPYFQLALLNNFLEIFSVVPLVFYRVQQNAKRFLWLSLSKTLLQMLLTFLFIMVLDWGILGHYYGRLFSLIPFFIIYWVIMIKNVQFNINISQIKQALRFSIPLLPGVLAYIALSMSDRLILEPYVSVGLIGIYSLAYTLAFTLNMVIQGFYKAIEPEIFRQYGTSSFDTFIQKAQNGFFFITYLGAMVLTLFSQEVFKLMASTEFYAGYLLIPILMIGVLMTAQNVIFGGIIIAEKRSKVMGGATFVAALISVAFNIAFIPWGGIYVAATSSTVSFMVMNMILYHKMTYPEKSLKKPFIALALFVLISFGLFYGINISFSWSSLLIKILLLILYAVGLSKIFALRMTEIKQLIRKKK